MPKTELQHIVFKNGIFKVFRTQFFSVPMIKQQLGKNASRLQSLLNKFNDDGANVSTTVQIDKSNVLVFSRAPGAFDEKKVTDTGRKIAFHKPEPIVIKGLPAPPVY